MSATSAPSSARLTNDEPSLSDTFEGYDYTVSNKSLTITNEGEYNEDLPSDQESTRGCDSIGSHQTEEDHQQKESIATTIALNEAMIRQLDDFNKTQDDKYLALGASALRQYNQKLEEYTVGAKANEDRIWKKRYYEEFLDRAEVLSRRLRDDAETCIDELKAEIERTRLSCRDEESWRDGEKEDWMADLD